MENRWRGAQAIETARELLMYLQPLELHLAFYIDKQMVEYLKATEDWLRFEGSREDPNLVTSMTNLINRIKRDCPQVDLKYNKHLKSSSMT